MYRIIDLAVPADHRVKINEHGCDGDTNCGWCTREIT